MRRTTVYLETDLELALKREMLRRGQTMAELIREALRAHLTGAAVAVPPGGGQFASTRKDTATHTDAALAELGFGRRK